MPRVPANFVARDELRDRLGGISADFPVTLVCAPAGFGKTLLLADWMEETGAADKAWVSLDEGDNDAGRFWTAVLSALCACVPVPPSSRLHTLHPPGVPDAASLVAEVIDGLAALPVPLYLVCDDLQEVLSEQTWHGIATLVRHQPHNLRLVLSTRSDPQLPLARLRLEGKLAELRADELRFTADHAAEVLRHPDTGLDRDQIRRLVQQTEGWPAGLRLAARSLRAVSDPNAFLAEFAGNDRAVADFLVSEVLTHLPSATADVLALVSVCDEVTPELATALSGQPDAGATLAGLERDNSLVLGVGANRRWFRTHPLLRSYLLADLTRRRPGVLVGLHETASAWFAEQARPDKAIEHLTLTGENHAIIELLRKHAATVLLTGDDHRAVRRALEVVGVDAVRRTPWLALLSALAYMQVGDRAHADGDLQACQAAWPVDPDVETVRLRQVVLATYALVGGRPPAVESLDWSDVIAAHKDGDLEAWARLAHGWTLFRTGRASQARRELEAAARLARRYGLDYVTMHCLSALSVLACKDGMFPAMESMCASAVELAYAHGWTDSPWLSANHLMLGVARLQSLDPGAALDEARHAAAALPTDVKASALLYGIDVLTGAALTDVGRRHDGLALLQRARHDFADRGLPAPLLAAGALIEHRSALNLGRESLAKRLMTWTGEHVAEIALTQAWTSFARGDLHATEAAAHEVLDEPRPALSPTTRLEARLLETALEIRLGRRTKARGALDAALELAEPMSLVRPFYHADDSVRRLLLEQVGGFGRTNTFAARVIQLLSTMDNQSAGVLTSREHAVLMLLASPQSLDELASDMSVSVNTVKTHVRAIYTKLGVNNRRGAVIAGRQLGLG